MANKNGSEGVNMTEDEFMEKGFLVQKKWPASEEEWFGLN